MNRTTATAPMAIPTLAPVPSPLLESEVTPVLEGLLAVGVGPVTGVGIESGILEDVGEDWDVDPSVKTVPPVGAAASG
jgi:hypothetical protein